MMESSFDEEEIINVDSTEKTPSNFAPFLENNSNQDSSSNKNFGEKSLETNIINLDDKIDPLDKIDQNFQFEDYSFLQIEKKDINFEDLSGIKIQNNPESFDMNCTIKNLKHEYNLLLNKDKLKNLIEKYENKNINQLDKKIVKCLLNEKDGNNNVNCNCIPLITIRNYSICFYCDNHEKEKFLEMNIYSLLENIDKLFIEGQRENPKEKNEAKDNDWPLEEADGYELNISYLLKTVNIFIEQKERKLKEKIEDFKSYLSEYDNKSKNDETLRAKILQRIKQTFFIFLKNTNILIYFIIAKSMINEFQNSYNLKGKNKIILVKNLNYVYEVIEKNKDNSFEKIMEKTHKEKKKGHNSYKFDWIIEFYFDEEIKSDCDKNIFIALSCWGDILIFSINLFKNSINNKLNSNEGKKRPYEIIKIEKIDIFKPTRITKLKKLFKPKKNNNFFIINSRNSSKWGQAVIINVIENPDVDLKKRYNIKIIQKIDDINGLFSSIEFYYKENTYLLNFYNNFYLWEYNSEINQIEKHIIENNIINNDQIFNYGPLMFEENKKLFIIQCFSPYFIIEFYNLAEKNDEFSFQKIDKVIEFENEDNMPLKKIIIIVFIKAGIYYFHLA